MTVRNIIAYTGLLSGIIIGAFYVNPEQLYSFLGNSIHHPINASPLLIFKLHLIKINLLCLIFLLFRPRNFARVAEYICSMIPIVRSYFTTSFIIIILIIIMFQAGILFRDIIDTEKLLYEKISGTRVMPAENILPNDAEAADLSLPDDFSHFIATAQKQIPLDAPILYLGVERYTANYFLYPRKIYQPPDYEWIHLATSEIIKSSLVKEKKISFIIRKYRPRGFQIEQITP